jgi:hypothetical protein
MDDPSDSPSNEKTAPPDAARRSRNARNAETGCVIFRVPTGRLPLGKQVFAGNNEIP